MIFDLIIINIFLPNYQKIIINKEGAVRLESVW